MDERDPSDYWYTKLLEITCNNRAFLGLDVTGRGIYLQLYSAVNYPGKYPYIPARGMFSAAPEVLKGLAWDMTGKNRQETLITRTIGVLCERGLVQDYGGGLYEITGFIEAQARKPSDAKEERARRQQLHRERQREAQEAARAAEQTSYGPDDVAPQAPSNVKLFPPAQTEAKEIPKRQDASELWEAIIQEMRRVPKLHDVLETNAPYLLDPLFITMIPPKTLCLAYAGAPEVSAQTLNVLRAAVTQALNRLQIEGVEVETDLKVSSAA